MFKVTFTLHGFIVAVIYQTAKSAGEALELALFYSVNKYDNVKVASVEGDRHDAQ